MLLSDIADEIGGELKGNPDTRVIKCSSIEKAQKGDISFIGDAKFLPLLESCSASALITGKGVETEIPHIETENPTVSFSKVMDLLHPEPSPSVGVHLTAVVDFSAKIGDSASIGAYVTVGSGASVGKNTVIHSSVTIGENCVIGDDCIIHPQAVIINGAILGNRVVVHPGTVIGSDGFKYERNKDGVSSKVRHIGRARIGNDVEIGANCAIDRGFLDDTIIEDGVKLDNLVHIAHNVKVGEHSLLAGQFGVAGSTEIGKRVMTGGQVGVADHIKIADGAVIAAKSGVTGTIKEPGVYAGIPASPISLWRKSQVALLRLPDLIKKVRKLEKGE